MTVAHDAATESTFTTTSPHTFSHTPVGTPRGVIVTIAHQPGSSDTITGDVTYGGVRMRRVGFVADAAGEPGGAYLYFLGRGIPTGAQTVSITHGGSADTKHVVCITVTAAQDTIAYASATLSGDQANPQSALDLGSLSGLRYCVIYSGLNDPTNLALLSGMTAVHDHDYGTKVVRVDRETAASSGSFTIGYTSTSDDVAMVSVAVSDSFVQEFSDAFTEASDTNLDAHTPTGGVGSWSKNAGAAGSNAQCIASDDTLAHPYHSGAQSHTFYTAEGVTWGADQVASAIKPQAGNANIRLAVRLSANDDGYAWCWDGGSSQWQLIKYDNGTPSTIGFTSQANPGTWFQGISAVGSTIKGLIAGSVEVTQVDTTYATGKPGVVTFKSLASAGADGYVAYHIPPAAQPLIPTPILQAVKRAAHW